MATFEDIVHLHQLTHVELTAWIQQRWVRPRLSPEGYVFDEVDDARVALICELRKDFMVNDDALGVVLSLLDQLYAARQLLRDLESALAALPEPMRREVRTRLRPPE